MYGKQKPIPIVRISADKGLPVWLDEDQIRELMDVMEEIKRRDKSMEGK